MKLPSSIPTNAGTATSGYGINMTKNSFVGSLLDKNRGAGWDAKSVDLLQPATVDQANQQYANVNTGLSQQQAFLNALAAQGGIGNQANVFAQQQALANQLAQQAMGQGPNPALSQFNQATGQNIAAQAAMMAGQRGASANAGLIARQIAQQGAATQQQASGQAATLQAQQQLAAQQALQNQQAQMASLAGNQVQQQGSALGNYNQFAQGAQQNILNSIANQNQSAVGLANGLNNANVEIAKGNQQFQADFANKAFKAGGTAMGMPGLAHGGMVGPQSKLAQYLCNGGMPMMSGGMVPGQAKVSGDSRNNDTVQVMVSPDEIVIPRSITTSKDAPKKAAEFVAKVLARGK
jgi:hypothetical protein